MWYFQFTTGLIELNSVVSQGASVDNITAKLVEREKWNEKLLTHKAAWKRKTHRKSITNRKSIR